MLKYPEISPVIFQIGPLALRWYGLMYAVSFFLLITLMRRQAARGFLPLSERMVERLFMMLVVCILAGARLFYILFYSNIFSGSSAMLSSPFEAFAIWHGGAVVSWRLRRHPARKLTLSRARQRFPGFPVLDTLGLVGPIGLALGRIGNFINGELYGRATTMPWGMVFPADPLHLARHPSQLYESFLEGVVLAAVLWTLKGRVKRHGVIAAVLHAGICDCTHDLRVFPPARSAAGVRAGSVHDGTAPEPRRARARRDLPALQLEARAARVKETREGGSIRIVSLIASSTEIVCALGFGDQLVGRSHECDYPEWVKRLPSTTGPKFKIEGTSRDIDSRVMELVREGLSVYRVDAEALERLKPDVIVTQIQCEVCAVSQRDVEEAVCKFVSTRPRIVSLNPNALVDIWTDIRAVAAGLGAPERGEELVARLQKRLDDIRATSALLDRFDRCAWRPSKSRRCTRLADA